MKASRLAELTAIALVCSTGTYFAMSALLGPCQPRNERGSSDAQQAHNQILNESLAPTQHSLNPAPEPTLVLDGMPAERVDIAPTHGESP